MLSRILGALVQRLAQTLLGPVLIGDVAQDADDMGRLAALVLGDLGAAGNEARDAARPHDTDNHLVGAAGAGSQFERFQHLRIVIGVNALKERRCVVADLAGREAEHLVDHRRAHNLVGAQIALPQPAARQLQRELEAIDGEFAVGRHETPGAELYRAL